MKKDAHYGHKYGIILVSDVLRTHKKAMTTQDLTSWVFYHRNRT